MANQFYNVARHDFATGQVNWPSATAFAVLVTSAYTFDVTETTLTAITAAIPSGCTAQALSSVAVTSDGTVSADSVVFSGVTSGQSILAVIVYVDQGGGRFDPILYFDTAAGFPLTSTGADITVDWKRDGDQRNPVQHQLTGGQMDRLGPTAIWLASRPAASPRSVWVTRWRGPGTEVSQRPDDLGVRGTVTAWWSTG